MSLYSNCKRVHDLIKVDSEVVWERPPAFSYEEWVMPCLATCPKSTLLVLMCPWFNTPFSSQLAVLFKLLVAYPHDRICLASANMKSLIHFRNIYAFLQPCAYRRKWYLIFMNNIFSFTFYLCHCQPCLCISSPSSYFGLLHLHIYNVIYYDNMIYAI